MVKKDFTDLQTICEYSSNVNFIIQNSYFTLIENTINNLRSFIKSITFMTKNKTGQDFNRMLYQQFNPTIQIRDIFYYNGFNSGVEVGANLRNYNVENQLLSIASVNSQMLMVRETISTTTQVAFHFMPGYGDGIIDPSPIFKYDLTGLAVSMEAWIYIEDWPENSEIFYFGIGYSLNVRFSPIPKYICEIMQDDSQNDYILYSNLALAKNEWGHILCGYNNFKLSAMWNGASSTKIVTKSYYLDDKVLSIGGETTKSYKGRSFYIRELRVWQDERSLSQFEQLANKKLKSLNFGYLKIYYRFDQVHSSHILDSSVNIQSIQLFQLNNHYHYVPFPGDLPVICQQDQFVIFGSCSSKSKIFRFTPQKTPMMLVSSGLMPSLSSNQITYSIWFYTFSELEQQLFQFGNICSCKIGRNLNNFQYYCDNIAVSLQNNVEFKEAAHLRKWFNLLVVWDYVSTGSYLFVSPSNDVKYQTKYSSTFSSSGYVTNTLKFGYSDASSTALRFDGYLRDFRAYQAKMRKKDVKREIHLAGQKIKYNYLAYFNLLPVNPVELRDQFDNNRLIRLKNYELYDLEEQPQGLVLCQGQSYYDGFTCKTDFRIYQKAHTPSPFINFDNVQDGIQQNKAQINFWAFYGPKQTGTTEAFSSPGNDIQFQVVSDSSTINDVQVKLCKVSQTFSINSDEIFDNWRYHSLRFDTNKLTYMALQIDQQNSQAYVNSPNCVQSGVTIYMCSTSQQCFTIKYFELLNNLAIPATHNFHFRLRPYFNLQTYATLIQNNRMFKNQISQKIGPTNQWVIWKYNPSLDPTFVNCYDYGMDYWLNWRRLICQTPRTTKFRFAQNLESSITTNIQSNIIQAEFFGFFAWINFFSEMQPNKEYMFFHLIKEAATDKLFSGFLKQNKLKLFNHLTAGSIMNWEMDINGGEKDQWKHYGFAFKFSTQAKTFFGGINIEDSTSLGFGPGHSNFMSGFNPTKLILGQFTIETIWYPAPYKIYDAVLVNLKNQPMLVQKDVLKIMDLVPNDLNYWIPTAYLDIAQMYLINSNYISQSTALDVEFQYTTPRIELKQSYYSKAPIFESNKSFLLNIGPRTNCDFVLQFYLKVTIVSGSYFKIVYNEPNETENLILQFPKLNDSTNPIELYIKSQTTQALPINNPTEWHSLVVKSYNTLSQSFVTIAVDSLLFQDFPGYTCQDLDFNNIQIDRQFTGTAKAAIKHQRFYFHSIPTDMHLLIQDARNIQSTLPTTFQYIYIRTNSDTMTQGRYTFYVSSLDKYEYDSHEQNLQQEQVYGLCKQSQVYNFQTEICQTPKYFGNKFNSDFSISLPHDINSPIGMPQNIFAFWVYFQSTTTWGFAKQSLVNLKSSSDTINLKISQNFYLSLDDGNGNEHTNINVFARQSKWFHMTLQLRTGDQVILKMNDSAVISQTWFTNLSYKDQIQFMLSQKKLYIRELMILKDSQGAQLKYNLMNKPYPKLNSQKANDLFYDYYSSKNIKVYLALDGSDKSPIGKRILNQVTGTYLKGQFDQQMFVEDNTVESFPPCKLLRERCKMQIYNHKDNNNSQNQKRKHTVLQVNMQSFLSSKINFPIKQVEYRGFQLSFMLKIISVDIIKTLFTISSPNYQILIKSAGKSQLYFQQESANIITLLPNQQWINCSIKRPYITSKKKVICNNQQLGQLAQGNQFFTTTSHQHFIDIPVSNTNTIFYLTQIKYWTTGQRQGSNFLTSYQQQQEDLLFYFPLRNYNTQNSVLTNQWMGESTLLQGLAQSSQKFIKYFQNDQTFNRLFIDQYNYLIPLKSLQLHVFLQQFVSSQGWTLKFWIYFKDSFATGAVLTIPSRMKFNINVSGQFQLEYTNGQDTYICNLSNTVQVNKWYYVVFTGSKIHNRISFYQLVYSRYCSIEPTGIFGANIAQFFITFNVQTVAYTKYVNYYGYAQETNQVYHFNRRLLRKYLYHYIDYNNFGTYTPVIDSSVPQIPCAKYEGNCQYGMNKALTFDLNQSYELSLEIPPFRMNRFSITIMFRISEETNFVTNAFQSNQIVSIFSILGAFELQLVNVGQLKLAPIFSFQGCSVDNSMFQFNFPNFRNTWFYFVVGYQSDDLYFGLWSQDPNITPTTNSFTISKQCVFTSYQQKLVFKNTSSSSPSNPPKPFLQIRQFRFFKKSYPLGILRYFFNKTLDPYIFKSVVFRIYEFNQNDGTSIRDYYGKTASTLRGSGVFWSSLDKKKNPPICRDQLWFSEGYCKSCLLHMQSWKQQVINSYDILIPPPQMTIQFWVKKQVQYGDQVLLELGENSQFKIEVINSQYHFYDKTLNESQKVQNAPGWDHITVGVKQKYKTYISNRGGNAEFNTNSQFNEVITKMYIYGKSVQNTVQQYKFSSLVLWKKYFSSLDIAGSTGITGFFSFPQFVDKPIYQILFGFEERGKFLDMISGQFLPLPNESVKLTNSGFHVPIISEVEWQLDGAFFSNKRNICFTQENLGSIQTFGTLAFDFSSLKIMEQNQPMMALSFWYYFGQPKNSDNFIKFQIEEEDFVEFILKPNNIGFKISNLVSSIDGSQPKYWTNIIFTMRSFYFYKYRGINQQMKFMKEFQQKLAKTPAKLDKLYVIGDTTLNPVCFRGIQIQKTFPTLDQIYSAGVVMRLRDTLPDSLVMKQNLYWPLDYNDSRSTSTYNIYSATKQFTDISSFTPFHTIVEVQNPKECIQHIPAAYHYEQEQCFYEQMNLTTETTILNLDSGTILIKCPDNQYYYKEACIDKCDIKQKAIQNTCVDIVCNDDLSEDLNTCNPQFTLTLNQANTLIRVNSTASFKQNQSLSPNLVDLIIEGEKPSYDFQATYKSSPDETFKTILYFDIVLQIKQTIYFSDNAYITLTFKEESFKSLILDQKLAFSQKVKLNSQVNPQFQNEIDIVTDFSNILQQSFGVSVGSSVVGATFIDTSLKSLWGLVNAAQFYDYLIIIDVNQPPNAKIFFETLSFASGEFSFVENIPNPFSNSINQDKLQFKALGPKFQENQYESSSFYLSFKDQLIFTIYLVSFMVLLFVFGAIMKGVGCVKLGNYMMLKGNCNSYTRLFFEVFLPLTFCAIQGVVQIQIQNQQSKILNLTLNIIAFTVLIVGSIMIILKSLALIKYSKMLTEQNKESQILKDINLQNQSKPKMLFYIFFLLERILFVSIIIFLRNHVLLQLSLLIFLYVLFILYICITKPFKAKAMIYTIVIDHLCFVIVLSVMIYIHQNNNTLEERVVYNLGYLMIGAVIVSLGFNLICVLVQLVASIVKGIKYLNRVCKKRKKIAQLKKYRIEPENVTEEQMEQSKDNFTVGGGDIPVQKQKESGFAARAKQRR